MIDIDQDALEVARKAVEDLLIDFRDRRVSILAGGNGFVIREADGAASSVMRFSTSAGLEIGIKAYLEALEGQP